MSLWSNFLTPLLSLISGGLSGAVVSTYVNRAFRNRQLRTQFYPKVNDIYSAYLIRMETRQGRYWETIVGYNPSPEDAEFVEHRSAFILSLVQFNELKEARTLRRTMLDNSAKGDHVTGQKLMLDLQPESNALAKCLGTLHKKLEL